MIKTNKGKLIKEKTVKKRKRKKNISEEVKKSVK